MQLKDVFPSILLSAIMAAVVLGLQWALAPLLALLPMAWMAHAVSLALSFLVGVTVYFVLAARFKVAPFREYVNVALPVLKTRLPFAAKLLEKIV